MKALDQTFRICLIDVMSKGETEEIIGRCIKLIKLCIDVARIEICSANMPSSLLSDVYDALTIDKCEEMFSLVEEHLHIWKEDAFFTPCKNILLRLCNGKKMNRV